MCDVRQREYLRELKQHATTLRFTDRERSRLPSPPPVLILSLLESSSWRGHQLPVTGRVQSICIGGLFELPRNTVPAANIKQERGCCHLKHFNSCGSVCGYCGSCVF